MSAAEPAIALTGLSRRYGRQFVLRNVNLVVGAGRTVVLRGGNGAGKTTLLKVLATRLRPSLGRGEVFGFDLVRQGHEVRRRTAFLSVLGGAYPALSAEENLRLAARLYGRPGDDIEARLAAVGLFDARHKPVRSFSSGMRKRLGLARLLLADARLWLLDEPYTALDEDGKALVDRLLEGARAGGVTVLLASHEIERSGRFADAVLTVGDGRLHAARAEAVGV